MIGIVFLVAIALPDARIANETIRAMAHSLLRHKVDHMELSGRALTLEKYRGDVLLYSHPQIVKDPRRIKRLLAALAHSSRAKGRLEPLDADAPTDQITFNYSDHGKLKSLRLFFDDRALLDDWGPEVACEFKKYQQRAVLRM